MVAWATLRDEKDWAPQAIVRFTESFGPLNAKLKETLETMKPKESANERKKQKRREAREARERQANKPTCNSSDTATKTKQKHVVVENVQPSRR